MAWIKPKKARSTLSVSRLTTLSISASTCAALASAMVSSVLSGSNRASNSSTKSRAVWELSASTVSICA
ncbi:Uncharacterised protein [Mycobacteroides abscessus subsp. abscessus]|nr:Uncharacterised protein [Mycobacteroides abscessus subsp. abscessus]